jgi:excisionase family DNA binding protein
MLGELSGRASSLGSKERFHIFRLFRILRLGQRALISGINSYGDKVMAIDTLDRRPPTENESAKASEAASAFARGLTSKALPLRIDAHGTEVRVDLPRSLGLLLLDLLTHVARGEMVTLVPYGAELTTQQAADVLNVSRPFLIKLLEQKKMAFHKVGAHRRIPMSALMQYKNVRDKTRARSLKELQRLGQEYDEG